VTNTVAIVTGASQGMGRATAIRLAKDFSRLVLVARNKKALEEVARQIRTDGAQSVVLDLDLSKPEAAGEVVEAAMREFGRMTDQQWRAGMELKLHGARRLTIKAWEALKAAKGSVVFMSGSAALDPKPAFAAVAATNAAIIALAKAFAEQGIKDGVQVNSIIPGAVMTHRRKTFMEKWAPAHNMTFTEAMEKFPREVGISRYGRPEEIAELMAFMVSPMAKWMTGSSLRMDGGEVKGT